MKLAIIALTLLQSFSALATSPMLVSQTAQGTSISATPALTSKVDFSVITVDYAKNEVVVELYNDICGSRLPLPPGTFRCMAMPIVVNEYRAPIQSIGTDVCGATVIKASRDARPVDGALTEITVTDFSTLVCRYLPEAQTTVEIHEEIHPMTGTGPIVQDLKILATQLQ